MVWRIEQCTRSLGVALIALFTMLVLVVQVHAAEVIQSYRSDIKVEKSGQLIVTETIKVNVEHREINHGIFRDFPLTFQDENGKIREVDFDLISVERNGEPEPYHTQSISGGIRIYAGSADFDVPRGEQTYRITYSTARQIGYGDDFEELYWNVTGNGWLFPIEKVTAVVTFPDNTKPTDVSYYTGGYGSTAKNARSFEHGGATVIETTRPLSAGEGLTISLSVPRGTIDEPTEADERRWWWRDNRNTILGVIAVLIVWAWYGWSWSKVGRDPPRGVMVPRWDAPNGISPALVNYIDNKGFADGGWKAFSAASINLAVKGLITLDDLKSEVTMKPKPDAKPAGLPPGEAKIFDRVRQSGEQFRISKSNGETVKSLGSGFRNAIEKEHRGKYYQHNIGYVVAGILLSVIGFVAIFVFGGLSDDAIFMSIFPNALAVVFGIIAGVFGRGMRNSTVAKKSLTIIILGFFGVVVIGVIGLLFVAAGSGLYSHGDLPAILAMSGIVIANIVFFFIMGAPTPLGAKMMAGIDGLRQYLTFAEKDRMNMRGAPQMSPQHFETLLPYAVALGVEEPWTEHFEKWLESARMSDTYKPGWYSGGHYGSFGRDIGNFSSSMASTVRSTLPAPPPSSSGSGGGGFSGGGGGGGGGGGW